MGKPARLPYTGRRMLTLPNLLTLSRIVALPLLVWLLWWPQWEAGYAAAFVLYCLMGITDYFDGYLARAQGTVSKLGVFLDPIADKIMVACVIVMLVGTRFEDRAIITGVHLIAALIILLREIMVSGLREFLGGIQVSVPVSKLAKWKTTLQLVALGALILAGAFPGLAWIKLVGLTTLWGAAALTLVTGWDYLRVGLKHMDS
jgi:CDP-diacylglycerol--glycerol-3-phosphate 3-phosphatidyltransferase/cardiolipin synthase